MMKQISTRLLTVLGLCMFFLSACNNSSDFTVKGVVAGADGQLMYLENVGISNVVTLDSIKLAPGGKFKFTEKRPEYPDFYRLRLNNQLINFAVDSTETISFVADAGTFATSYSVEGSENSKAIKAITLAQLDANQAIRRLRKEYEDKMISDTTYRTKILAAADDYKEVDRNSIYSAPMSIKKSLGNIFIRRRCPQPPISLCSSRSMACCSLICMTGKMSRHMGRLRPATIILIRKVRVRSICTI